MIDIDNLRLCRAAERRGGPGWAGNYRNGRHFFASDLPSRATGLPTRPFSGIGGGLAEQLGSPGSLRPGILLPAHPWGNRQGIQQTAPEVPLTPPPGGAALTVLKDHALGLELVADAVGFGEVFRLARGKARGDLTFYGVAGKCLSIVVDGNTVP